MQKHNRMVPWYQVGIKDLHSLSCEIAQKFYMGWEWNKIQNLIVLVIIVI